MNDQMVLMNNMLFEAASRRVNVPKDFHGRARIVKKMLDDDISGMVDTLTDFAVQSASVDFNIEVKDKKLAKVFKTWMKEINVGYQGRIPSGIKALSAEYFKERWKGASFPVLKISKWEVEPKTRLVLPTKMYFLDGGSLYARDNYPETQGLRIDQYDYSVGADGNKLKSNVIFSRSNGRWFDKYPNPYLIKRGVYRNFEIISSLKRNEIEVLDQIIPYLLQIKKGTEKLTLDKNINYNDAKLKSVFDEIQKIANKINVETSSRPTSKKIPVRVSQFDEEIKHLIPDLDAIFNRTLFEVAEKNILAGLGFIDVVDGAASTRRESILNPRPFIQEVQSGVSEFCQILTDLAFLIKSKNEGHKLFENSETEVTSSPVKGFMSDKFKQLIRSMWDRGTMSSQTATELIAEVSFENEVNRREKEAKEGTNVILYPHLTMNQEGKGKVDVGINEDNIVEDRNNPVENKNFNKASLDQAKLEMKNPYPTIRSLPEAVKAKIKGVSKRRKWLKIFDSVFNWYKGKGFVADRAEAIAFATAWEKFDSKNNKPVQGMQNEK